MVAPHDPLSDLHLFVQKRRVVRKIRVAWGMPGRWQLSTIKRELTNDTEALLKDGRLHADLRHSQSALEAASRICHSTGANNAINKRTGKPERICRGSRDIQLQVFYSLGVISEATDEAWAKKCEEMGIK